MEAVSAATTAAWCYVPAGSRLIAHSSIAFRRTWFLGSRPKYELTDEVFLQQLSDAGFSHDWLEGVLSGDVGQDVEREFRFTAGTQTTTVRQSLVRDSGEVFLGHLLMFDREQRHRFGQDKLRRFQDAHNRIQDLSDRETQILDMVYDGLTSKAIARETHISEKTVEKHRSRIMQKLGVPNAIRLVRCVTEARMAGSLMNMR